MSVCAARSVWADDAFSGSIVAVTGAASGIGAAISRRFLEAGAGVVGGDVSADGLVAFVSTLDPEPATRFSGIPLDVSDSSAASSFIAEILVQHDRLDVLVNNAGIAPVGAAEDTTDALWRQVMSVDLDGAFYVARAALPALRATQGSIVNTASVSGIGADYNYVAYNAAKGAVVNLTRALAIDSGRAGVRVNAIAPGPVRTPLLERNFVELQGLEAAFNRFIPFGRIAEPSEVADAALFLASTAASFITGVILPVDGGVTAWNGQPNGDFIGGAA
jgi:meso-butanediol dehydrogenase / (S,S)-butanediol dehydrogenase / diacetyl reductase